jgi:hypothetical protein
LSTASASKLEDENGDADTDRQKQQKAHTATDKKKNTDRKVLLFPSPTIIFTIFA